MTEPGSLDLCVVDVAGSSATLGHDQVADIAAAYRPSQHEAPVVLGEPRHDAPAFGWVQSLRAAGSRLYVRLQQVHAPFKAALKRGLLNRMEATFYKPESANSPTPGRHYLRDLRFDGDAPIKEELMRPFEGGLSFSDPTQEGRMADDVPKTKEDDTAGPWGERLSSRDIAGRAEVWRRRLASCGEDLSVGEVVELVRGDVGADGASRFTNSQAQLVAALVAHQADMSTGQALAKVNSAARLVARTQSVSGRIGFADAVVLCVFCAPDGSGAWGQGLSERTVADRAAVWAAKIGSVLGAVPVGDVIDLVQGSADGSGRVSLSAKQVGFLSIALEVDSRAAGRPVAPSDMAEMVSQAAQAIGNEPVLAGPTLFADAVAVWATCAPPPRGC